MRRRWQWNIKVSGWTLSVAYLSPEISCYSVNDGHRTQAEMPSSKSQLHCVRREQLDEPTTNTSPKIDYDYDLSDAIFYSEKSDTPLWIIILTRWTLKRFESPNDASSKLNLAEQVSDPKQWQILILTTFLWSHRKVVKSRNSELVSDCWSRVSD